MDTVKHISDLPEVHRDQVHIWGICVPDVMDRMDRFQGVMSKKERDKAARFHCEADRYASVAARGALRILLAGYSGMTASAIVFSYSRNGKPHISGSKLKFNVSHSGDWVVIAIGRDRSIGVDIEQIKRPLEVESIAARYFSAEEQGIIKEAEDPHTAFFQLWARKEAYVKACGSTLFTELKRMSVPMEDGAEKDGWFFHYLEAGSKYAAAVVTDKPLREMPCYDFGGLQWEN